MKRARWLKVAGLACLGCLLMAVAVGIFMTKYSICRIADHLMKPLLHRGDIVLVERTDETFTPQKGEVILLSTIDKGRALDCFRKVIGVPGDEIDSSDYRAGVRVGDLIVDDLCVPESLREMFKTKRYFRIAPSNFCAVAIYPQNSYLQNLGGLKRTSDVKGRYLKTLSTAFREEEFLF